MFRSPLRAFAVLVVSLTLTTPLCEAASPGSAPGRARQAAGPIPPPRPVGLVGERLGQEQLQRRSKWTLCEQPNSHGPVPTARSLPDDTDEGCAIDPGGRNCHVIL